MKKPIIFNGNLYRMLQAIRGLFLLGETYISIELKEKDSYVISTQRTSPKN